MSKDRKFIRDLIARLGALIASPLPQNRPLFLFNDVVPGGGKTRITGVIGDFFRELKIGVFVPRLSLMEQTAQAMKEHFGIDLREISGNSESNDPSRGGRGWITTYNTVANEPDQWMAEIHRHPYFLSFDEGHHLKVYLDGTMNPFASACEPIIRLAKVVNIMSGTLTTSDNAKLLGPAMPHREEYPWLSHGYIQTGSKWNLDTGEHPAWCDVFVRYSRLDALLEKAICPLVFHNVDGLVEFTRNGSPVAGQLSSLADENRSGALLTALETGLAVDLLRACVSHWVKSGSGKLLVIAHDQKAARQYMHELRDLGIDGIELAISDEPDSHKRVKRFRHGSCRVLVSVAMAYEGLDVPEITHVVFLTRIRSVGWVQQAFARAWRALSGKHQGHVFVPDDVAMNAVIESIQADQQRAVIERESEGPGPTQDPDLIEPIKSQANGIDASHLDGAAVARIAETDLRQLLGRDYPSNVVDAMVRAAISESTKTGLPVRPVETVTTQETKLRNQINARVRHWCLRSDAEPGEHFGRIKAMNRGKSLGELSLLQLQMVWSYVQNNYPAA
jgi:superfamily II DNA or RNA helicase